MDATYFPLFRMNYILNDTTQIVDLKMMELIRSIYLCVRNQIVTLILWYFINFIFGFAYADIFLKEK